MIVTVKYKGKDIPVTIDAQDADLFHAHKWYILVQKRPNGTQKRYLMRKDGKATVYFHREALGVTERATDVDHKDGDGLNNSRENIRVCTRRQNKYNGGSYHGSSSRHKGVSWDNHHGRWLCRYTINRRSVQVGYFDDEDEAGRAYDKAVRELHGAFFHPNFPEEV